MDFAAWLKEWALPLSAGATFLLALAAFWAILQNYLIRKKEREWSFKVQALDEINEWANNLLQAIMNIHAPDERSKIELTQRLQYVISIEASILTLAQTFKGQLKEKVSKAQKSVNKLQATLFTLPDIEDEGYFSTKNKEHAALVKEAFSSLDALVKVVCEAKINLFLHDKNTKSTS